MVRQITLRLLMLTLALLSLGACSVRYEPVTLVEPSYSHLRDYSVTEPAVEAPRFASQAH